MEAMTVIGKYNYTDNALFVVGNGTNTNNRKDAYVVKDDGDVLINPFNPGFLISLYDRLTYLTLTRYL